MHKLDLSNPEESQIPFKISKFPDGQQSVEIGDNLFTYSISEEAVQIRSRFNSFRDLELIICATRALRGLGVKEIHLYVPYFLGARSDRKFIQGGINYIKEVSAPIINLQGFSSVTVFDPHSDVLEACLSNYERIENTDLVKFALFNISGSSYWKDSMDFTLVSPDAGALKKVFRVAEDIRYTNDIIIASKHRDLKTGKITHTDVPGLDNCSPDSNFIIIDDICDGGRTFIEIAKAIQSHVWPHDEYFRGKIYLIVSHGIFSGGLLELSKYFEKIS